MRASVVAGMMFATDALPANSSAALPDEILGYYSWNWGAGSTGPAGANMGCAFTGLIDVDKAIAQYTEGAAWCCPALVGQKILTVGGGNAAGTFTATSLKGISEKMGDIKAAGYTGVMYDVEEVVGSSSVVVPLFAASFSAAKKVGLLVGVTTSHSAPYKCDSPKDAVDILKAWCADSNIDIISPQLYSSGQEGEPDLAETNSCKEAGCTWSLYRSCKAEIAPSIVRESHYAASKAFFSKVVSRDTRGYFMWAQEKGDAFAVSASKLPDEIVGYYSWNWGSGSSGPPGANVGCSFTGLIDVDQAIAQYTKPALLGQKFLTVGGGNAAGIFTKLSLKEITTKVDAIKRAGYAGVMYDVEEVVGSSSVVAPLFAESFSAAKKAGLLVGVTTSHSAPYQCDSPKDAVDLLKAWCADSNVDIISPQLYSSGQEGEPDFAETSSCRDAGCTWDLYTSCKADIAPSIVHESHYDSSKEFFEKVASRETRGYFVWAQENGNAIVI